MVVAPPFVRLGRVMACLSSSVTNVWQTGRGVFGAWVGRRLNPRVDTGSDLGVAGQDQTALVGERDGLGAVSHTELGEHVVDVGLDGRSADEQAFTDLLVAVPVGDLDEDCSEACDETSANCSAAERAPP